MPSKPAQSTQRSAIETHILLIFLASAAVLSLIRAFGPLIVVTDPSLQIGAAWSLINGQGINTYALSQDISQGFRLQPTTQFAPSFPILIAACLKLGLSIEVALRVIYFATTLIGWWGWGLLFKTVVDATTKYKVISQIAIALFGVFLPLYFTPDWCGTDIFLWSGIPFLVYGLTQSSLIRFRVLHFVGLGALVGFLYSFRYAASFLILYLLMGFVSEGRHVLKKILSMTVGFAIFYVLVGWYRATGSETNPVSSANLFDLQRLLNAVKAVVPDLRNIQYLLFSHPVRLIPSPNGARFNSFVGLGLFFLIILLSFIVYQASRNPDSTSKATLPVLLKNLAFLNLSVIFFLLILGIFTSNDFRYISEARYYYVIFPSIPICAYGIAHCFGDRIPFAQLSRRVSLFYLGLFLIGSLSLALSHPEKVFGFHFFRAERDLIEYPSNQLLTRRPVSYEAVLQLLRKNPNAIAISFAEDFDFSHTSDPSLRRRFFPADATPASDWESEQKQYTTSRTIEVYLIFRQESNCSSYCYYQTGKEVKFFQSLPHQQIYFNQKELIQIVSVKLPSQFKFRTNPKA